MDLVGILINDIIDDAGFMVFEYPLDYTQSNTASGNVSNVAAPVKGGEKSGCIIYFRNLSCIGDQELNSLVALPDQALQCMIIRIDIGIFKQIQQGDF